MVCPCFKYPIPFLLPHLRKDAVVKENLVRSAARMIRGTKQVSDGEGPM